MEKFYNDKRGLREREQNVNRLFAGLGSVRIVKNSDLGLEDAVLGQRARAAFSRTRAQFFTIWTDPKPANYMYISVIVVATIAEAIVLIIWKVVFMISTIAEKLFKKRVIFNDYPAKSRGISSDT